MDTIVGLAQAGMAGMTGPMADGPLLLACANSFWNLHNFRGSLLKSLQEEGFRIQLAAGIEGGNSAPTMWPAHRVPIRSDGLNPLADARLLTAFVRLFRRTRPAAYLSWTAKPNIYGALAARLVGVPAFPNVSGLGTAFIRGEALQRLLSVLYRLAFSKAPAVFFQNREDLDLFVERKLVRADQARLLPGSGVDLSRFVPPDRAPRPAEQTVFLFVGRLLGDKGVRELAEAARSVRQHHPEVRFQLLGFLDARNRTAISQGELASWVDEGSVEYLGSTTDVRPYLADADAVILPSYREGLPRSLLEAAAMGRPLLASDVPGCREVVSDDVNGIRFDARSAPAIANACLAFLDRSDAERSRMGAAARQLVQERFSEQRVVEAYVQALGRRIGQAQESMEKINP